MTARWSTWRHALGAVVKRHPQLLLEDKGLSLAFHYRRAPHLASLAHRVMHTIRTSLGDPYCVHRGKRAVELAPAGRDKGLAIRAFMRETPFRGKPPMFIGDDVTDEHGFRWSTSWEVTRLRWGQDRPQPGGACHRYPPACKQFRELLDCYVDGELSVEAVAAAGVHLSDCSRCARAAAQLEQMRQAVRQVVSAHAPPADLDRRVRRSLKPWWVPGELSAPIGRRLALAAVLVLAVGVGLTSANGDGVAEAVAGAMDRVVIRWTSPTDDIIEGRLVCRDCEPEKRHGERAICNRIGHHGAIETRDGRIWNIVEQPASADLIHNNALLGKMVRVRARLFRKAGSLTIATYTIVG